MCEARTTGRGWSASAVSVAVVAFFLCAWMLHAQGPDLPPGPMRTKARTACLECHDAFIIQQQQLDRRSWQRVVDKMIRWGALVEPQDREPLLDYLTANFGPEKTRQQPAKTAHPQKQQGK